MQHQNPFGSWAEAGQGHSSGSLWNSNPAPSVFGALPYPPPPSRTITYYLTGFKPDIFNCCVIGSQNQVYYQIVTDSNMPGYTVIKNAEGKNISLIEWQAHPFVEIRGVLAKQNVMNWLRVSPDNSYRSMEIRGTRYIWAPRDKSINLYSGGNGTPAMFLAKVTRSGNQTITIEMIPDAIQLGLLDPIVTATTLLLSGRNID
ncbi:hypothetical protein AGABI2DRAFT_179825 [Agaricus bisporus var. bisporus H97]|uniref:hypothetical protein n=1 Tax=Agaricus bisporus var. bisporus (strain H97 / ATCC MYA-4626 / FGSC 10389) TaxID=936046 RepID=UPI00029F75F6|nr:hypothetical protein AGABI2DRAFT_179825 [Agaricus bisporus var. bisporus H97]EKV45345.1 hypothetical protein AGABI2DRAFT_179825 [Agaricus bisporus var. bisporus H97]